MNDLNEVLIASRLTRDPLLRKTHGGTDLCTLTIATERSFTRETGARRGKDTLLIPVTARGALGLCGGSRQGPHDARPWVAETWAPARREGRMRDCRRGDAGGVGDLEAEGRRGRRGCEIRPARARRGQGKMRERSDANASGASVQVSTMPGGDTRRMARSASPERVSVQDLRPSSCRRGYGVAWREIRALQLARFPSCQRCGAPATEADHTPAYVPGTDHAAYRLTSLCHRCHSKKTGRELGAFAKAQRGGGSNIYSFST